VAVLGRRRHHGRVVRVGIRGNLGSVWEAVLAQRAMVLYRPSGCQVCDSFRSMMDQFRERLAVGAEKIGVPVIWNRLSGQLYRPVVNWPAEDLSGFLGAAHTLGPSAIYAGPHMLSDDDVDTFSDELEKAEHAYGPEAELSLGAQALVDEAARHVAELIAFSGAFMADGSVHIWSVKSEWYQDYTRRHEALSEEREERWFQRYQRSEKQSEQLRARLIGDEQFLRQPNLAAARIYAREFAVELFGEEDVAFADFWGSDARLAWEERNRSIVPARRNKFHAELDRYAAGLVGLPAYQKATTKTARRVAAKAFLQDLDPLVLSGENVEILIQAADDHRLR
jgi:hypothetical protein